MVFSQYMEWIGLYRTAFRDPGTPQRRESDAAAVDRGRREYASYSIRQCAGQRRCRLRSDSCRHATRSGIRHHAAPQ